MEKTQIEEKLKQLISRTIKLDAGKEIPQDNLFASLGIDSLLALELLVSIEQDFSISIADEDLNVDLLSSLSHLVDYIHMKKCA